MKDARKVLQRLLHQSPWTKREDWMLKFREYRGYTYAYWWHENDGDWGKVYDDRNRIWYGTCLGKYKDEYVGIHSEVEL